MEQDRRGADAWGVTNGHWGTDGAWHDTPAETRHALRRAMGATGDEDAPPDTPVWVVPTGWGESLQGPCHLVLESGVDHGVLGSLPADLPTGRHRLVPTDGGPTTLLIVRPPRCHPAPDRSSALAVQLYAARSRASWGIGDFRDLRVLGEWARSCEVDLIASSPLHAPSPASEPQPSPYYPSSRRFLSPLHISVDDVAGASRDDEVARLAAQARALLDDRRIDRRAVWSAKLSALERLFDGRGTAIDAAVESFRVRSGDDLERWATFCAISEAHPGPWQSWPSELRHPDNAAVARFAAAHSDRLRFHAWLQWLADSQLRGAVAASPLIVDLAVGVDPGGADAWADQDLLALDARIGAPPDDFAPDGQDWGLPPYIPHALRADGYESFARTLRANMHPGDGIRIDHALGLFRTYWIPPDGGARSGAYVRAQAEELLAVLAIESERAGTFVVGEDLGTVEDGVRETLAATGVLGTRVVYFEGDPPSTWPPNVLGAATTHDLPTIAGIWTGADQRMRADAGLGDDGTGGLRPSIERVAGDATDTTSVICAVHVALSASPAAVVVANLDDVLEVEERPNMPGTVAEWPNWSIALPTPLDGLVAGPAPPTLRALTGRDGAEGTN